MNQKPVPKPLDYAFNPESGTLDGIRLHSRARPGSEINSQLSSLPNDSSPLLIIGLGLGDHLIYIQKAFPKNPKLVLELNSEVWAQSLSIQKTFFESYPNLWGFYYWSHLDQFSSLLSFISPNEASLLPHVIVLPAYRNLYSIFVNHCIQIIQQKRERKTVNSATLRRFGKLWLRNTLRNISHYSCGIPIQDLFGKFTGIPAILLGAGPSLDELLPWVLEIQNQCLIMAVDTALRPTLTHGLRVDFTMILEPQYWNTRHLDFVYNPDVLVITEISTHPRAYQIFEYPPILAGSTYPLGAYLEQGYFARLGAGGSVATSAWDFLNRLGVSEIYLVGIDLAFPKLHTHAAGSLSEQLVLTQATRLKPTETGNFTYLQSGKPIQVMNNLGEEVTSDMRMNIYAAWFESQCKNTSGSEESPNKEINSNVKTFTLSPQARALSGITFLDNNSRNKLTSYPSISQTIQSILHPYKQVRLSETRERKGNSKIQDQVHTSLSHLISEIEKVIFLSNQGLTHIETYRSGKLTIDQLIEYLNEIDHQLSILPGKRVFGFLMEDIIQLIQTLPDPENFEGSIERTFLLYKGFLESAQWLNHECNHGLKE
jgi:hypothetical protein